MPMAIDGLKISLFVGLVAIAIGVLCLSAVAWANAGSRNMVLATGTLGAAILLFIIQLPFELRERRISDFATSEFTIDRAKPEIRQWSYPSNVSWRISAEVGASSWLAQTNRVAFDGDRERLTLDMILFSLIQYFVVEQSDWQLKRVIFRGTSVGTLTTQHRISKESDCTLITEQEIRKQLSQVGNVFSGAPIMMVQNGFCLPPNATMKLENQSLEVHTPFCRIIFSLQPSGSVLYMKPGTGGQVPLLPTGQSQFETWLNGVKIEVVYSRIRAQHREADVYKAWSERVVQGTRVWFEGS